MIYICIPTHNEQQTVGVVLWKLRQVLTEFHRDYQLLVADDASTDKTTDVLEPYTRVLPLTVIRSETRQGYAASLEMLLREAVRRSEYPRRDVIVTLQADFSEEPDDVVGLIKRMEAGADVAVGVKVSTGRDTRLRRMARTLSSFFTRRETWPEGVVTPFDGYRAYRLHAVKRAIEERDGRRLLRYDGWAGHAELLRAVLPHARRVDTLNVEDRPDRLQRPRRERPFAAAWQVRAMARGAEPHDLVGVDELDRIAATASRSRERAVLNGSARPMRPARTDGRRRPSDARDARDARDAGRGRSDRSRPERPERPERGGRLEGQKSERGRARPAADSRAEPRRTDRQPAEGGRRSRAAGAQESRPRRPQESAPAAAPDELAVSGLIAASDAQPPEPVEGAAPKKRRRRRRRSGSSGANAGSAAVGTADAAGGEPDEASRAALEEVGELLNGLAAPTDDAGSPRRGGRRDAEPADGEPDATGATAGGETVDDGGEGGTAASGERKRRRRGGTRRGGRGRRRRTEAGAGAETTEGADAPDAGRDAAGGGPEHDAGAAGQPAARAPDAAPAASPAGPPQHEQD